MVFAHSSSWKLLSSGQASSAVPHMPGNGTGSSPLHNKAFCPKVARTRPSSSSSTHRNMRRRQGPCYSYPDGTLGAPSTPFRGRRWSRMVKARSLRSGGRLARRDEGGGCHSYPLNSSSPDMLAARVRKILIGTLLFVN